jgi:hypothetical protein
LRDSRTAWVAIGAFVAIIVVVVIGIRELPDSIAQGTVDTKKGETIAAILAAALTAIGTVVGAYFGVRAANAAREDTEKSREIEAIHAKHLAAALPRPDAESAIQEAEAVIKERGLS